MDETAQPEIRRVDVKALELDPENPRLPEKLLRSDQEILVKHLFEEESLDEIAQSMIDNGFFAHEPLIIRRVDGTQTFRVLEGNRRLATLIILLELPAADGIGFPNLAPTAEQIAKLREVPCFEVDADSDPHDFLGFRHIGGVKTWSAEAKARYLRLEVEAAVRRGSEEPFKDVGRRVGSNAIGVRNSFIAMQILIFARDELGIDTAFVQANRFGVWLRCMNSPGILSYIGYPQGIRAYDDIIRAIQGLNLERLNEVLNDLTPRAGSKALIQDSRQVTTYGNILQHDHARKTLRKTSDFSVAAQIVESANLPVRIKQLADGVEAAMQEIMGLKEVEADIAEISDHLANVSRSLAQLTQVKRSDR